MPLIHCIVYGIGRVTLLQNITQLRPAYTKTFIRMLDYYSKDSNATKFVAFQNSCHIKKLHGEKVSKQKFCRLT